MRITIDGPAAAGKTSTARALAGKLGITYLNTGSIYRAAALRLQDKELPVERATEMLDNLRIRVNYEKIFLNGEDVTDKLHTQELSDLSSRISAIPEVRAALLGIQQRIADSDNIVLEGRDTGSIVCPYADFKFYLTADLLTRAERRYQDEVTKGSHPDPIDIAVELKKRDERDMNRDTAPLVKPKGSIHVDNTNLTLKQTMDMMLAIIAPDD